MGLSLIIIGLIEQIYRSLIRNYQSFSPFFLTLLVVGTAILAYGYFSQAETVMGVLNAVIAVSGLILLIALIIRRGKPGAF
jgi:hypothetical protein